jgi:hypothetical protein
MSFPFYRLKCCCPVNGVSNTLFTTTNNTFNKSFTNSFSNTVIGLSNSVFNKSWTTMDLRILIESKVNIFNRVFIDSIVNLYFKTYIFGYTSIKAIISPLVLMGFCKDDCCGINSKVNILVRSFTTLLNYPTSKIGEYVKQEKCGECDEVKENILQFKSSTVFTAKAEVKHKVSFNPVNVKYKTSNTGNVLSNIWITARSILISPLVKVLPFNKKFIKGNSTTTIDIHSTIADDGIVVKLRENLEYSYNPVISIDMKGKSQLTLDLSNSLTDDITNVESETRHSYLKRSVVIIPNSNNISLKITTISKEYFLNLMVNNYDK